MRKVTVFRTPDRVNALIFSSDTAFLGYLGNPEPGQTQEEFVLPKGATLFRVTPLVDD